MAVLSLIHCRRSCVWYYTVSAVIFIMQIWTVHLTRATFFLFVWLIPASLFYTCSSCMIHELGGCWRVWCAISRIIKLSINDFCSQTNTCVAQWAAVSGVVHISYVLCPYRAVCTESLCACLRVCVRACVYEIIYSLFFPYKFCSLAPYPQVHLCLDAKHMQLHTLQARLHIVQALIV